ncbi:MAG: hypothetical protein HY785_01990 [Oscillatoriophycideae cyanobacterium NC_groundwater_1537_Pr4_S-0.65um_50_18]|nr:hypothetical protein [Candidatus Woesearchaeota archaeon]MBI4780074.1 hypothetical protein [Oscillatoriophycideae cyanobacterium NC_groundwater_1537_Pr4_S-0.65um_50_18]
MASNKLFRASSSGTLTRNSSLNFGSRSLVSRSEFGDDRDDAEDLGTLKSGRSYNFSGDVGGEDLDFFKFKLGRRERFSAKLKNESDGNQPIAISILNTSGSVVKGSNGKFLFANVKALKTFTLKEPRLAAGTYFLRLQSAQERSKDEDYELSLSTGRSSEGGSGSGSIDNAQNLGSLSLGQTRSSSGSVGSNDTDFFKFNIGGTSRVVTRVTNNSFDQPIALTVLDSDGNPVKKSNGASLFVNVEDGDTGSILAPTLRSGTYYLRFTSAEGSGEKYSFSVQRSAATVSI